MTMTEPVILALITLASIAVSGILTPILVGRSHSKRVREEKAAEAALRKQEKDEDAAMRRREKLEDYARQDEVARLAKLAADAALEANKKLETVTTQIDGMLRERDRANLAAGAAAGAAAGVKIAETLAAGQLQGREIERESAAHSREGAPNPGGPLPVVDDVVGEASKRIATATEVSAEAAKVSATAANRTADAAEEAAKK